VVGDILQPTHLLFILVIALLVLGPKRLPEVGRSLGRGLRDFRHAISSQDQESDQPAIEAAQNGESPPPPVQEAATVSVPAQEPATVAAPAQEPASVSAPAQEPASVSAERGSSGSA
jgi:sec-independent protein translocase protein TatA